MSAAFHRCGTCYFT